MTRVFDFDGPNLDRGFVNLRAADHPDLREMHDLIERMWERYEPYADPDFRHGFARDVDGRGRLRSRKRPIYPTCGAPRNV